jgi:hypothetical protein
VNLTSEETSVTSRGPCWRSSTAGSGVFSGSRRLPLPCEQSHPHIVLSEIAARSGQILIQSVVSRTPTKNALLHVACTTSSTGDSSA